MYLMAHDPEHHLYCLCRHHGLETGDDCLQQLCLVLVVPQLLQQQKACDCAGRTAPVAVAAVKQLRCQALTLPLLLQ